jgi:hypothetical protein
MECIKCVFPRPTPPYKNRGLQISPGASATFRAYACAKLLLPPTTKVSNVYLGFKLASSILEFKAGFSDFIFKEGSIFL